ncbi:hypothetical protein FKM82_012322 [Ascaphus truei]
MVAQLSYLQCKSTWWRMTLGCIEELKQSNGMLSLKFLQGFYTRLVQGEFVWNPMDQFVLNAWCAWNEEGPLGYNPDASTEILQDGHLI